MADVEKTQHFTTEYKKILKNINFFPDKAIDPFAGNCDLRNYSPDTQWEFYDLVPTSAEVIQNDSLLNPIDYTDKSVITNPPYLAKNKTKEFADTFKKYDTDDLYKAAMLSLIGCKNGILIIPINFFTDEATEEIRKKFLSIYKVSYVNVFDKPVFKNTTYNVCSFYFEQGETTEVEFYNVDTDKHLHTELKKEYGYRLGGEFYNSFSSTKKRFSRVRTGNEKYITKIFLEALDTRKKKISLSIVDEVFIGKNTDRVYATLVADKELNLETQQMIVDKFNSFLNQNREEYMNLILTNYRDFGRKRICFDDVFKLCTKFLEEVD